MKIKGFSLVLLFLFVLFSCLCVVSAESGIDDAAVVSGSVDDVGVVSVNSNVNDVVDSVSVGVDEDNISSDSPSWDNVSTNAADSSGVGDVLGINADNDDVVGAAYENSFSALQELIDVTPAGSTVLLDRSYAYDVTWDTSLVDGIIVNKSLIIDGQRKWTVSGSNLARCFNVSSSDVSFQNLTISDGYRPETNKTSVYRYGGCFYFQRAININIINCKVIATYLFMTAGYNALGAAVFAQNVNNFNVINSSFSRNSRANGHWLAGEGAGLYLNGNVYNVLIRDSNFTTMFADHNIGNGYGGAIRTGSAVNLSIIHCRFTSTWSGDRLYTFIMFNAATNITIKDNYFNHIHTYVGLIYFNGAAKNITIYNNNFTDIEGGHEALIYLINSAHDNVYVGHNYLDKIHVGAYSALLFNSNGNSNNVTVESNIFNNVYCTGQSRGLLHFFPGWKKATVLNNTFTNCYSLYDYGLIWAQSPIYIHNNTFNNYWFTYNGNTQYCRGIAIYATNTTLIDNNTFVKGYFTGTPNRAGGVIYIEDSGSAIISNNTFRDNNITRSYSTHSGVIYNEGNNTVISNNSFFDNYCTDALGGIIYNSGNNVQIYNNNVTRARGGTGGVIYNTGSNVEIYNINSTDTYANDAGAFYLLGENVNVHSSYFENVHADNHYGAIYADAVNSNIHNNTYVNIYEPSHGAVAINNNVNLFNETFLHTRANNGYAGAILLIGDYNKVYDIRINDSSAFNGGAIYDIGSYNNITNISINNSMAVSGHGGALYIEGSNLNVSIFKVYNTNASLDGGAVYNSGEYNHVDNATFENVFSGRNGGVIFWSGNYGNLSHINITDVYANGVGGAVYLSGSDTTMSNFTVRNAHSSSGGAIYCLAPRSNLFDSKFFNIRATGDGGAIFWTGSNANLTNLLFDKINSTTNGGAIYGTAVDSEFNCLSFNDVNATENGGVLYWAGSGCHLYDINMTNVNSFTASGGAIYWSGDRSSLRKGRFINVTSEVNAALYWSGLESNMSNVTFINCKAKDQGGAVYWTGSASRLFDAVFINNTASNGGGVFLNSPDSWLYDATFTGNNASNDGGAVYWMGNNAHLYSLNCSNNSAGFKGGAISLIGNSPVLYDLNCSDNRAGVDGGALIIDSLNANLTCSTFVNNSAVSGAGALHWSGVDGILYMVNFTENRASVGGALYWASDYANVSFVNFTGNSAVTGGALYMGGLTGCELYNCSFMDNGADGIGGAIYWSSSNGVLLNSTFYNSSARDGGAIYWAGDNAVLNKLEFDKVSATSNGGIVYISASNVNITNSTFANSNASSGVAIYWLGADGVLAYANFTGNNASLNGGAIYWMGNNANVSVVNFTDNRADIDGGALYIVSYGAYLNTVNFTHNGAANYGGGMYWGGKGNCSNAEFMFNDAFSGSAIYNSGILDLSSAVVLNNTANISSIEVNSWQDNNLLHIDTVMYGWDNFLNGIWTTSDNIQVNRVIYYGVDGETTSDSSWIRPVNGVSETGLYFDSRLAGVMINTSYGRAGNTNTFSGNTSIMGEFNSSVPLASLDNGTYEINAVHYSDDYYFYFTNSSEEGVGVRYPTVVVSLTESEVYYGGVATIRALIFVPDAVGDMIDVNGLLETYIDDDFLMTINITNSMAFVDVVFPDNYSAGELHNIYGYFHNASDDGGHDIGSNSSERFYFTIVKNYLSSIVNVSTVNSTYYVDESFNITLTGPAPYSGPIDYVAGSYNGTVQLTNGSVNIPVVYHSEGKVNVLIYVRGDDNYLPSSTVYEFNIIKRDFDLSFVNVSGNSAGSIFVGDDAVLVLNLSVNDTVNDVIVSFGGVDYNFNVNDSIVVANISGLSSGIYPVSARYPGDNKYNSVRTDNFMFTVSKVDVDFYVVADEKYLYVGDDAVFNIVVNSINSTLYPFTGVVSVSIAGKSYNVSVVNNSGSFVVSGLAEGVYDVSIVYPGNNQFNSRSAGFVNVVNVSRIDTGISVSPISQVIHVGDDALFDVNVSAGKYVVNGSIRVIVNGTSYVIPVVEGKAIINLSALKAGDYDMDIFYGGDYQFINSSSSASVFVAKYSISDMHVSVVNDTIYVGEDTVLNISIDSTPFNVNSIVTVRVNDRYYNVSVVDGNASFKVTGLPYSADPYVIDVTYEGDDIFNPYYDMPSCSVRVNKINITDINMTLNDAVIFVGDDAVFTVNVSSVKGIVDGYVIVSVDNVNYTVPIVNGLGSLKVSDLAAGNYSVFVYYAGDDTFNEFNNYSSRNVSFVSVIKKSTRIDMNSVTINVGDPAVVTANINSSSVSGKVTFVVDGVEYYESILNGVSTLKLYNITSNTTVSAYYSGDDKYLNSSGVTSLTVNKVSDSVIISVYDIVSGGSENVVIVLPSGADGVVSVKFNNSVLNSADYSVNGSVITFSRVIIPVGEYYVNVSLVNDTRFEDIYAGKAFNVSQVMDYSISVNVDDIIVGESAVVNVILPDDATGDVYINDIKCSVSVARYGVILPVSLDSGLFNVVVSYVDDVRYANKSVSASYRVYRAGSNVYLDMDDVFFVGDNINFTVNAVNSTGRISVIINDRVYYPSNNAPYIIGSLDDGTYNVIVRLDGDVNYNASSLSKIIQVIKNPVSIVLEDISSPVNVGDSVNIVAKFNNTVSGNVIFNINGVNYTVAVDGDSAAYNYVPAVNGTYSVSAVYSGDSKFVSNSTSESQSFTVNKIDTYCIVSAYPIYVGQDAVINVEVRSNEATGSVSIIVNNKTYTASLVDGKGSVVVSGLTNSTNNTVTATYNGDDKYSSSSNVSFVVVNKVDISFIDVSANSSVINVGENVALTINLVPSVDSYNVNGIVNVSVNGVSYNVSIVNNSGRVIIRDLVYGSHVVNVSYDGNDIFNSRSRDYACVINVVKVPVNITVNPLTQNVHVDDIVKLNITVNTTDDVSSLYNVNGVVRVTVGSDVYNVSIVNGKGYLTIYDLASGFYDVSVVFEGDSVFDLCYAMHSASVNVSKIPTDIVVSPVNISVGSVAVFTARLDSSDVSGNVVFVVDGVEYSSAIVNGVSQVEVYGLNSSADSVVSVFYSGDDKYLNSSNATTLTVNKVDDGIISVSVYDIVAGMSENAVIVLPVDVSNGTVIVKFNDTVLKSYEYTINNNVITFNRVLDVAGDYIINVSVLNDAKYNNINASGSFSVFKNDDYNIIVRVDDVVLGQNATVEVTLPADAAGGLVVVDGVAYSVSAVGRGVKLPASVTAGVHSVVVSYSDDKYANKTISVNYNVLKAGSSVYIDMDDVFYTGDDINFTVNTVNSTGVIHVLINNYEFNPSNASEYIISGGLASSTYNVIVKLDGDDNYEGSETSRVINVIKKSVSVELGDITSPVLVDDNVVIKAKFSDNVTGHVIFNVNGVNYTVAVNGDLVGYIYVPEVNGTYTVSAYYSGDDKFNGNSTKVSGSFVVEKIPTQLFIRADAINVGDDAYINVEVNSAEASGTVNIIVNGKSYVIVLNATGQGSVVVSGLTNSTNNTISASYSGDRKYNASFNSSNIVVNKIDIYTINVTPVSRNIFVGEDAFFNIEVIPKLDNHTVNGYVNVSIDNRLFVVPIVNNSGVLNVSGLSAGSYGVGVYYPGDVGYNSYSVDWMDVVFVNKVPVNVSVTPDTTDIYVGQYASFDVSVVALEDDYVVNGFVTVSVNDDSFNVSISIGSGRFNVYDLEYGVHTVSVVYDGDDTYLAADNTVTVSVNVNKVPVTVNVDPDTQSILVGDNAVLNITISPSVENYTVNGNVRVVVDGVGDFNVSITNGVGYVTFYDLFNATHNVHVYYTGDDTFDSRTYDETVNVLVNKRPTSISMNNVTLNVGDVAVITAAVNYTDVTGNVTFIVDNKEYTAGIINGVARVNVTNLNTSANMTITARYSGDYKYINSSTTASLNISKVSGNASIVVYNITAGETETVFINLPADTTNATVTVKFNDEIIDDYVINNNVISFNRTIQSFGDYSVSISVSDDCKYLDFSNSTTFTVFKVSPENYIISIDVNNTRVFESIPIIINLPNDANGTLFLSVDNITLSDSVNVVDGVARYISGNLSSGNHTISVTYENEKYDAKTVSADVFVAKIASSINVVAPVDAKVAHDIIITVIPEARSTGNVTAEINGKNYTVEDRVVINASDLLEGNYTVVVKLAEDDNFFESTNHTVFTVTRNNVSLTLNDVSGEVRVDHSVVLHVDLTANVTGSVLFNINDVNYTVNIIESDFAEYVWVPSGDGLVNVGAYYLGNDTYYPNASNVIVVDVFRNPIVFANISVHNIMVDDIEHVTVSLNESDATGIVIISINGTEYDSSIVNGSVDFDVSGLSAGTYNVIVFYGGDRKYLATNAISGEFNVSKYDAPIFIVAEDIMVLDDAVVIVDVYDNASGHISISVDGGSIYLPVVDGSVSWTVSNLSAGTYEVNAVYSGDYKYLSNSTLGNFIVHRYNSTFEVVHDDVGWTGDDISMSVKLSGDATGNVTLSVNGEDYTLPVTDGRVDFTIPMLDAGDYDVVVYYSGDYKYSNVSSAFNFTVNLNYPIIVSDDVVKYYKGSERLYVYLTNVRGDKLVNETLYITINGVTYTRTTNDGGACSLPINLPSGEYDVGIVYNTSDLYGSMEYVVNVTVLSTVVGEDLVKVFCNDSQYWACFMDSEGNALGGTAVTFNINGVFYTRTTNDDGWAKLNINLPAGEYIITAYNPVTGEAQSNLVKVLPRIVENYDLVKRYRNASQYVVRIIGDDALPVGEGVGVEFNINGVFYTRYTNASGHVKLNINLPVGEYIITAYHNGCTVSNTIIVLPND